MTLPADVRDYPDAVAQALTQLRLVGVNGPYSVLLGAEAYTTAVRLYLQESFTFRLLTTEAAVALAPPAKKTTTV